MELSGREIRLPRYGRMLCSTDLPAKLCASSGERIVGLIEQNRAHMRRYRQLPRVTTRRLRQSRYAFTSHSSSSCPILRRQKVSRPPQSRRAPSHPSSVMDNSLASRGHPTRRAWYALQGYNQEGKLSPFGSPTIQRPPDRRKSERSLTRERGVPATSPNRGLNGPNAAL